MENVEKLKINKKLKKNKNDKQFFKVKNIECGKINEIAIYV